MKIALAGLGTTGKIIAEYLLDLGVLVMVLSGKNSPKAGKDLGELLNRSDTGIIVESSDHLEEKLFRYQPDVLIDFSSPDFLSENISMLSRCGVNVVTAVTTYSNTELERIKNIAQSRKIGLVIAPNITRGVNVLMFLTKIAAQLQQDYDFEIIEEHHRNKKDSPSGTAKMIADLIDEAMIDNDDKLDHITPVHSIRSGGIVGRHKVLITGKYDQIEISHTSFSRLAFAEGAYKAAQFIYGKKGYYEMEDVLNLEDDNELTQQLPCGKTNLYTAQSIG